MNTPLAPKPYDEMPYAGDGKGYRPGDWMFYKHEDGQCGDWDNCHGHLYVVLPNHALFDLGSRAANCTMKNDRIHRCWIISGEAPNWTASKNGLTCTAGAGSILCQPIAHQPGWHGFLRNGVLEGD